MKKRVDLRTKDAKKMKVYENKFLSATNSKFPEMAKMAAGLSLRVDLANEAAARGEPGSDADYSRLVNSLGRCLESMGLSNWLNKIPPDKPKQPDPLADYLKQEGAPQ